MFLLRVDDAKMIVGHGAIGSHKKIGRDVAGGARKLPAAVLESAFDASVPAAIAEFLRS